MPGLASTVPGAGGCEVGGAIVEDGILGQVEGLNATCGTAVVEMDVDLMAPSSVT